jgi:hypothetical protein
VTKLKPKAKNVKKNFNPFNKTVESGANPRNSLSSLFYIGIGYWIRRTGLRYIGWNMYLCRIKEWMYNKAQIACVQIHFCCFFIYQCMFVWRRQVNYPRLKTFFGTFQPHGHFDPNYPEIICYRKNSDISFKPATIHMYICTYVPYLFTYRGCGNAVSIDML